MEIEPIVDKNRITNLLNLIAKSSTTTYIRIELNEYSGVIKNIEYDEIEFFTKFKITKLSTPVRVSFNYLNKYYYFDAKFLRQEKNLIYLQVPEVIYYHYRRKATRYKIEHLDIFADIKIVHIPDSPVLEFSKSKASHIKNEIYKELQKDVPDANLILRLILREIKEYFLVDKAKIVMPVKEDNIITRILKTWRKPLLVQRTQEREEYLKNPFPKEVVTFSDYIKFLRENKTPENKIEDFIKNRMSQYKKEDIFSVLYTPIFVSNLMPGYIYAVNTFNSKKIINLNEINYFKEISEIIHETLLKCRLNSLESQELMIKVIDISTGGLRLKVIDPLLSAVLQEGMKLRCFVNFGKNKKCFFIGIIKSKRKRSNGTYIGVEIWEILEKNKVILYNFIEKEVKK